MGNNADYWNTGVISYPLIPRRLPSFAFIFNFFDFFSLHGHICMPWFRRHSVRHVLLDLRDTSPPDFKACIHDLLVASCWCTAGYPLSLVPSGHLLLNSVIFLTYCFSPSNLVFTNLCAFLMNPTPIIYIITLFLPFYLYSLNLM